VAVAADGSVYVAGLFAPHGIQAGDVLLLKFSPDGSLIWQRTWDSGNTETGEAVAVANDGSVYVSGGSNGAILADTVDPHHPLLGTATGSTHCLPGTGSRPIHCGGSAHVPRRPADARHP
jgi:outer membrane protein assembly factor BamB